MAHDHIQNSDAAEINNDHNQLKHSVPATRGRIHDLAIIALLLLLPLILFFQQTIGGKTLLPTENLYQFEPYATYRDVVNAPERPYNELLSDLVLQNMQWKYFIRENLAQGEIPLWNPHQFSGIPFMAAGQQSTLYPLSILYYVMPLPAAYGWFTVTNLWLAGVFMFLLLRGLQVSHLGATISGITYQLAGMFIASAVHPMIIGTVVWMPLILLMGEYIIRQSPFWGKATSAPWAVIGALALACAILAGHIEITIYTLLILAYFAGLRLLLLLWTRRGETGIIRLVVIRGVWLVVMVVLGISAGGVQLLPLYEFVTRNWRAERSSLQQVLDFAHPIRDAVQFFLPNFYGSPAHHTYFDVFNLQMVDVAFTNAGGRFVTNTDWGIKNYVEAALYLGILPLIFAVFGLVFPKQNSEHRIPYRLIFGFLAFISLTFMFGAITYAVIYVLPGINQLNTAFRWIFGVTVAVSILAGFGVDSVMQHRKWARRLGLALIAAGGLTLLGLALSYVFFDQIEPLITTLTNSLEKAPDAFESPRMFYSYQFVNVLIFGLVVLASGAVLRLLPSEDAAGRVRPVHVFTVALVAVDLLIASWGFNPASDPLLLDFTPPAVTWLQEQDGYWRYTVVNQADQPHILRANITLRYGLDDVRGYDSIISKQYVDYMRDVQPQNELIFNRVAPLYTWADYAAIVTSEAFNRLNIRYVVTHKSIDLVADLENSSYAESADVWQLVHEDEAVRIWENDLAYPRVYSVVGETAPEGDERLDFIDQEGNLYNVTSREKFVDVSLDASSWLVVSETYAPGWRAFIRPLGGEESDEKQLEVQRVLENFQGVAVPEGDWTIRLIYSPPSFQVGAFLSVISIAIGILIVGMWMWRTFVIGEGSNSSTLARNSIAPILLNLFNRGIDFVFASIMFRILGPETAGFYYYAIVIFGWFDIFTNFGLDVYLMREAGRYRDRAGTLFYNTTLLRLLLVISAIPLLLAFLLVRQAAADPLNASVLLTIALFYVGLVPGSLSKGLTSLFYAFEKAEYPAAVTTVTTVSRVVLGLIVLLLGYGIVGLASVSIFTNIVTLGILLYAGRHLIGRIISTRPDGGLMRGMMGASWPLMLNHFLATIFFQIDIVILEWIRDARTVGLYRVAYSWLLAINIIPAFFTQALFPVMSRQAQENIAALRRTYTIAIKILVLITFPMAIGFTILAEPLTWLLGGSAYLPDGALALQIMIWSIPIGWMNSLTQYTLIAVDLQRRITVAFIIAVIFNITTNLIFIPVYGFQAAAVTTILSELVLFIPFAVLLQGKIGGLRWLDMIWRPVVGAFAMAIIVFVGQQVQPLLALLMGLVVYVGLTVFLKPFNRDELEVLAPSMPQRFRRLLGAA